MLSPSERQAVIIRTLVRDRRPESALRDLGIVQGAPSLERLADEIGRGIRNRIRTVMPRTVNAIWMEFGILADDYVQTLSRLSTDPAEESERFLAFVVHRSASLIAAPPYLADIGRLELAMYRAGRSSAHDAARCHATDPIRWRSTPIVWQGHYDLRPFFVSEARLDNIAFGAFACLVWRNAEDGMLRVVGVELELANVVGAAIGTGVALASLDDWSRDVLFDLDLIEVAA